MIGIEFILLFEALPLEFLSAKCPHHTDTCQIFLGDRGQPPFLAVDGLEFIADQPVKNQGADDHDRNKDSCGQGQTWLDRSHEIQGHKDQNKNSQQRSQLFGYEYFDRLDVRRAALDGVPRAVLPVPGIGKGHDVTEELVPHPAYKCLSTFRVADSEKIAADRAQRRRPRYSKRSRPKVPSQEPGASEPADQSGSPGRHSTHISANHRIYRELDHPGNNQIKQRDKTGAHCACQKVQIASL